MIVRLGPKSAPTGDRNKAVAPAMAQASPGALSTVPAACASQPAPAPPPAQGADGVRGGEGAVCKVE